MALNCYGRFQMFSERDIVNDLKIKNQNRYLLSKLKGIPRDEAKERECIFRFQKLESLRSCCPFVVDS